MATATAPRWTAGFSGSRPGACGAVLHTDDHGPYDAAPPVGRHHVGKDETIMSERHAARLRHCFARFRRRTVVASRSAAMVDDRTVALFARHHGNGAPFRPALVR